MLVTNVSVVIASLCIIIAILALALAGSTYGLWRGGQRECEYRKREAHKLIDEAEDSHAGEVRALTQRDSVIASLDEVTKELAEARKPQPFRDEVLTQAFELARLCDESPASPKAKNLLTRPKIEQLERLRGAVAAYVFHDEFAGFVARETHDDQLDDWAAQYGIMPVLPPLAAETVAAISGDGKNWKPLQGLVSAEIKTGGKVARPAPLGTLTNAALTRTKGVSVGD